MTRQNLFSRDVINTHCQSAPILLRRLGSRIEQRKAFSKRSAHPYSLYEPSSAAPFRSHWIRESYVARPQSKARSQLGARPFSHVGDPGLPSKQSKQVIDLLGLAKRPSTTKQSSAGSWITVIVVAVVSGAVFYTTTSNLKKQLQVPTESEEPEIQRLVKSANMTGEELPGRPGTLTPEQEEKLKEFWTAVLQVFGVLDNKDPESLTERSDTKMSDKKSKKKRMGLFRSKNKQDGTTSTESGTHAPAAEDDKYGQTKEFQEALANLSPETLRATFWSMVKHDHPDGLLLRFLRARKWDVERALVMMVSTMRWRSSDMHVDDDIMRRGELGAVEDAQGSDPTKKKHGEDFLTQIRLGKSFLHGMDKEGRPMCFVRVRLHKQGEQSEESLERYTIYVIESARMVLAPPVDTACIVFDMTGFSMANMDYAPVKFMIKCFEANYPESLGAVLVHKAPWLFQGVWKIIKGWLDPVVASKVHFTNEHDMEEYVPKSQIIKELHGGEDWEYKYIEPVAGENDLMKDTETRDKLLEGRQVIVDEYENATVEWIKEGTTGLKEKRNKLAIQLRDDYWRLDPYVRARSYYDRVGLIQPGGKLQFYPDKTITPQPAVKTETPATNGGAAHEHSATDVD